MRAHPAAAVEVLVKTYGTGKRGYDCLLEGRLVGSRQCDAARRLHLTAAAYVDEALGLALLVDPADRSIVRFEHGQGPTVLRNADRLDFGEVLSDFTLIVADVFASLRLGR